MVSYTSDDDEIEDEHSNEEEESLSEREVQSETKTRRNVSFAQDADVNEDIENDLYNLSAFSYHPIQITDGDDIEALLKAEAERLAQNIFKRLIELPVETSDHGPLCILPPEISILPKSHKDPEPKPETKWEKFAKEKGIKKRKRERMVFDEEDQQYKPRFGYKGINSGIEDVPIIEVKPGQDPYADPWAEARKAKKDAIGKNLKNQKRNENKALGKNVNKSPSPVNSYDPESVPGIPVDLEASKAKRGKGGVRRALQLVQHSTASMGRYDDMRKGEPARKIQGKKRLFRDNSAPVSLEKANMKAQLRIVADKADKKARGVTNSLASYEGIIPDAPEGAFRQKKGKGKTSSSSGGGAAGGKGKNGKGKGASITRRIEGKGKGKR